MKTLTADIHLDFKQVDEDGNSDTDESVDEVALEEEREALKKRQGKKKSKKICNAEPP